MQPGAVAVWVDTKFMSYKSGTLKARNGSLLGLHAMVIVGYHDGTSSRKVRNCKVEDWWVSCKEETEEQTEVVDA